MSSSAVIVSYNTHAAIGMDRRFAPDRIARVLAEIKPDIVALQELPLRVNGFDMLAYLEGETGFHAIAGPTIRHVEHDFGNGLLTRFPIVSASQVKLDVDRREPRGAIDALLDCNGAPLRVIATHLGLRPSERRVQVRRLLDTLRAGPEVPTVLLGDLNEWFLHGRPLRWLREHFGESPAHATFPSPMPLLALDRIWSSPASLLRRVRVHRSKLARRASDHLPLVARIAWESD